MVQSRGAYIDAIDELVYECPDVEPDYSVMQSFTPKMCKDCPFAGIQVLIIVRTILNR